MKLCTDCKFIKPSTWSPSPFGAYQISARCKASGLVGDGKDFLKCVDFRRKNEGCGPEAKLWEAA